MSRGKASNTLSKKSRGQPILVGVLSLVFVGIVYTSLTAGGSETPDVGFDGPPDLGLVQSELAPVDSGGWQPPAESRNPFVGSFSARSDDSQIGIDAGQGEPLASETGGPDPAAVDSE